MFGVEAVLARIDGLHVGVDGVRGCEDDGLIDAHRHNDWLQENAEGPCEGAEDLSPQRTKILALVGVFARYTEVLFEFLFTLSKDDRCVCFAEKNPTHERIGEANDCEDPEDPAPA